MTTPVPPTQSVANPDKRLILLVEDDETLRSVLRQTLAREGYEVQEAADGRAALKALARSPAALIITDIIMPEMEGIEFIMSLRKANPKVPVIAMSGGGRLGGDDYLELAQAFGAAGILAKPFDSNQLLGMVRELLGPRPQLAS